MKKLFDKLDKKYKIQERTGFSFEGSGSSSHHPPGSGAAQQHQFQQQQFGPPQQQQQFGPSPHQQQYGPPPQQQQYGPPPQQQQFGPPPQQQQFGPPPQQQQFGPPPQQQQYGGPPQQQQFGPPPQQQQFGPPPQQQFGPPPQQQQFGPPPQQQQSSPPPQQQFGLPPQQQQSSPPPQQQFSPPPQQQQSSPPPQQQSSPPPQQQSSPPPQQQFSPPPQQQQFSPTPPPPPPLQQQGQQQFSIPPPPPPPAGQPQAQAVMGWATLADVNRYRIHHGTNIGAVFVLERWLFPSMFLESAQGGSELSAVKAWVEAHGIDAARTRWEEHWASAMTPDNWAFLRDTARATSVRLPIGWFTLGPQFCDGTPFEPYAAVYANAWEWVKRYVQAAVEHGIGVLLDLHALPGGANADEHSGTDTKKSEFWENQFYRQRTTEVLVAIAQRVQADPVLRDWVVGIQLVNEAITGAADRGMFAWYDGTLAAIAAVDSNLPVYISDAWNSGPALDYAVDKNIARRTNPAVSPPVVVDIHKYYCFDPHNKFKAPADIIAAIPSELSEVNSFAEKEVGTVVGEYSCVLAEESWSKADPADRPGLVQQFGHAQSRRWEHDSKPVNGGAFFWTAKMQWMDGGEWGFVEQSKKANLLPPVGLTLSPQRALQVAEEAKQTQPQLRAAAIAEHVQYWNQHAPGQLMEHWRYEAGYDVGFWDAVTFWGIRASRGLQGGDVIGFVNLWAGKRIREHAAEKGGWGSAWLWEFEHGIKRGIKDVESFVKP